MLLMVANVICLVLRSCGVKPPCGASRRAAQAAVRCRETSCRCIGVWLDASILGDARTGRETDAKRQKDADRSAGGCDHPGQERDDELSDAVAHHAQRVGGAACFGGSK